MNSNTEMELKVGAFVTVGVGLIMLAILVLGSAENFLARKTPYTVYFSSVEGMITGAKVVIGGLQVGTVKSIHLDAEKRAMRVDLSVSRDAMDWIREDSFAEIATQGVLGDKYVIITSGNPEKKALEVGSSIPTRASKDFSQFLNKGDQLLASLNSLAGSLDRVLKSFEAGNRNEIFFQGIANTAKNLAMTSEKLNKEFEGIQIKSSLKNLNAILEKMNNGTGTLGALINDPGLYDDAKALLGGANRNRIMRNLVRQTIKQADEKELEEMKQKNESK